MLYCSLAHLKACELVDGYRTLLYQRLQELPSTADIKMMTRCIAVIHSKYLEMAQLLVAKGPANDSIQWYELKAFKRCISCSHWLSNKVGRHLHLGPISSASS